MTPAQERFVGRAVRHLTEYGTRVVLDPVAKSDDYGRGYYESGEDRTARGGELCLAAGAPVDEWLPILVHEYAHFLQQLDEDAGVPVAYPIVDGEQIRRWYQATSTDKPRRMSARRFRELTLSQQATEIDADHRAVELMREHRLGINIRDYIRASNAYHLFFSLLAETRRWLDVSPHRLPAVRALMPAVWLTEWELTPARREALQGVYHG